MSDNKIKWPDTEYQLLENGIRELVKALHLLGIKTIFSCEGHIRTSPIYIGVLPWPYVILLISDDQIEPFQEKINMWNKANDRHGWTLSKRRIHGSFTPEYIKSEILSKYPGHTVTTLCPINENCTLDHGLLAEMQMHAGKLAEFLMFQRVTSH